MVRIQFPLLGKAEFIDDLHTWTSVLHANVYTTGVDHVMILGTMLTPEVIQFSRRESLCSWQRAPIREEPFLKA